MNVLSCLGPIGLSEGRQRTSLKPPGPRFSLAPQDRKPFENTLIRAPMAFEFAADTERAETGPGSSKRKR